MISISIEKNFLLGKAFLYDSKLHVFLGKHRSRWAGPYIVEKVFPHDAIEIKEPTKNHAFKVNRIG